MWRDAYFLGRFDQANRIKQNPFEEDRLKLAYTAGQFDERTHKPFPYRRWLNQFRKVAERRAAQYANDNAEGGHAA